LWLARARHLHELSRGRSTHAPRSARKRLQELPSSSWSRRDLPPADVLQLSPEWEATRFAPSLGPQSLQYMSHRPRRADQTGKTRLSHLPSRQGPAFSGRSHLFELSLVHAHEVSVTRADI